MTKSKIACKLDYYYLMQRSLAKIIKNSLAEIITQITPYNIAIQRELHQVPEFKFKEEKTSAIIQRELKRMGLEFCSRAYTGVIATIEG